MLLRCYCVVDSTLRQHVLRNDGGKIRMLSLRRWQTWAFSFLGWTVYAIFDAAGSFAILMSLRVKPTISQVLVWNFATSYLWALCTPPIYALACRYSFDRNSWKKSLAVHMPASLAITTFVSWALIQLNTALGFADTSVSLTARLLDLTLQSLPLCFAVMGAAQAVVFYARFRERQTESSRLEARLAQAQLEILRSQMEPHFLFNALNSIATLTRIDPASAERMTLKLAALLRVSLDCAGSQEIPLKQELAFLQNYLDIQQTRFQDRLTIHLDVDPNLLSALVPSLILQPLVENAIRHGIAKSAAPGYVNISAARDNGSIKIEIADNGVGVTHNPSEQREGFGLRNTRARLQQLYGDHHHFHLENAPGGGCRVSLMIPLLDTWRVAPPLKCPFEP
jgi:two-component system LytT family sensor kinase